MSAPTTTLVRRGEALRWLREHGISEHVWRQVRRLGKPKRITLTDGRGYYETAEIREVFLSETLKTETLKC